MSNDRRVYQAGKNRISTATATVIIAQEEADGQWYLILRYDDGEVYVNTRSWETEAEATQAAYEWVAENHVPDTTH